MTTSPDGVDPDVLLRLRVHAGQFEEDESWVYAWFSEADQGVVYVGATRLPPPVRTWLHLHDADPDLGRLAARLPRAMEEDFEVLAVRVATGESRLGARDALVEVLREEGLLSRRYAGPQPDRHGASEHAAGFGLVVSVIVEAVRQLRQERAPRDGPSCP